MELDERTRERLGSTLRGKYRLDAVLGIGGMAVVYEATHRNGKRFAIKMLHAELAVREDIRRRFLREGYVANAVDHPGAVSVLDDDIVEDGAAFLVMELLSGSSVDQLWKDQGRRLPVAAVLEIARQLLAVLAAAHAKSIVHRDIKPANLFVLRDGTVKVLDFGIARVRDTTLADSHATGTGAVLGTPAYMAPEQALADADRIDARTDLWAVGATMFALLAGRLVHEATNPSHLLVKAATERAQRLAEIVPTIDPRVAALVDRALEVEPSARWPQATEMMNAIDKLGGDGKDVLAALAAPRARRPSMSDTALAPTRPPSEPPEQTPPTARAVTATTVASGVVELSRTQPAAPVATTVASVAVPAPRAVAVPPRTRRLALAVAGALVVAGVVFWISHTYGKRRSPATDQPAALATVPESGQVTALISFANETPEPGIDETLDLVLATALYRSPRVQPYAGATLRELATELGGDATDGSVARLLAHDHVRVVVVRGKVASLGHGYTVALTATDGATGAQVLQRKVEAASAHDLVPAVGRLAAELVHVLGGPAPAAADATRTGMSDDLEADHELVVARALVTSGNYVDAITHADHAVALDPELAPAHAEIGIAYWNLGRLGDADRELKLALRSIDRMSEHDRLKFLGDYYGVVGEFDKSIASMQELLAKWPADFHVEGNLALTFAEKRDVSRALEIGRRVAGAHPHALHPRINHAIFDVLAGRFDDALREATAVIADFPHPPEEAYVYLAVAQHELGHEPAADAAIRSLEAVDASQAATARADLLLATGHVADAIHVLDDAVAVDEAHANHDAATRKYAMLAEAWLRHGDRARAAAAADRAALSTVPSTRFMAARVYVGTGEPVKALALADHLADDLAPDSRMYGKVVQGEELLARGKSRDAITTLEDAVHIADSWLGHEALARAYLERGAYAEAHTELDACTKRLGEASIAFMDDLSVPTTRYLAYVQYYLARAQDGLHSPDAQASYRAFVAGFAADDRDPLVVDARRRLAKPDR